MWGQIVGGGLRRDSFVARTRTSSRAHHGVAIDVNLLVLALVGDAPTPQALAVIALLLQFARHFVVDVGWDVQNSFRKCSGWRPALSSPFPIGKENPPGWHRDEGFDGMLPG